jgi:hypothetical protein
MRRVRQLLVLGLLIAIVATIGLYVWRARAEAIRQQRFLCRAASVQARLVPIYRGVLNHVGASDQEISDYIRLANESAGELCSSNRALARERPATRQLNTLDQKIVVRFQQTLRGDPEVTDEMVRGLVASDALGSCVAASKAADVFVGKNILELGSRSTAGSFSSIRGASDGVFGRDFYTLSEAQYTKALDVLEAQLRKCESSQSSQPGGGSGALSPELQHGLSMCFQSVLRRAIDGSRCNPYADDEEEEAHPTPDRKVTVTQKITKNGDGTETVKEYDGDGNLVEEYTRKSTSFYDEVTITHYDDGTTEMKGHREPTPSDSGYRQVTDAYWAGKGGDYQETVTYSDGTTEVRTHRKFTDEQGNTQPGPYFDRIRPTNKCIAFRQDAGTLSTYAITDARAGAPRPGAEAPSMMDGFNHCMCEATGKPMAGYQCPEDVRRWACLTMPFGPDDAPRPECGILLEEDRPLFRPKDKCETIRCNPDETKASFDSTRTMNVGSRRGQPTAGPFLGCGCFPKTPSITPAGSCSTVMCGEGTACRCNGFIGCGCLPVGGSSGPGGRPRPGWGRPQ